MPDVESRLLTKIIKERDVKNALKQGVKPSFFHGSHKDIWKYIVNYYKEYGVVPHRKIVCKRFPNFKLAKVAVEPYKAIVDDLREREHYECIRETIEKASQVLRTDSDAAYKIMMQGVSTIATEIRSSEDSNWNKTADERIDDFKVIRKQTQFGIPTAWKPLDKLMLGFQDQHLITVAGRPGVGKSWWVVINALAAWLNGFNPLIITKEMSVSEIERRLDAIHAKVPYAVLRAANKMEKADRIQFYKALRKLKKEQQSSSNIYVSGEEDGDGGVLSVTAKIDEYRPDIVFIDGAYLLRDDQNAKSKVEKLYNITQDLKRMARRMKMPVIITCQLKRGTHGDRGGDDLLGTLQWSDSFGQDSDEVIKIYTKPEFKKTMYISLIKQREGETGDIVSSWNFETMNFNAHANVAEAENKLKARLIADAKSGKGPDQEDLAPDLDDLDKDETMEGQDLRAKLKKLAEEADRDEV